MTNVLLYCCKPILANGLRMVIQDLADYRLLSHCSEPEGLKNAAQTAQPELIVIETSPAVTLEFLRELKQLSCGAAIVLWVDSASSEFLAQSLSIGIRGILRQDQSIDVHAECIRTVSRGEVWLDRAMTQKLLYRNQVRLTPRERQLIGLLAQGLKNKEIAYSLGIAEGTVKVYLSKLFPKVGAKDRLDLALMGLRNVESAPRESSDRAAAFGSAAPSVPLTIPQFLSTEPYPRAA